MVKNRITSLGCLYKLAIFYLMLSFANSLLASSPQLKSITMTMEPMIASMQRLDNNGKICALVKVIIQSNNVSFEGNIVGNVEFKTNEYWCYLSHNTRYLKIKYPNLEPLMIDFKEHLGAGVQSKRIYEVNIVIPSNIRSTGVPIRLNVKMQGDYYDSWNREQCTLRTCLVKKNEHIDVYVNLNNGKYDSHIKVEKKFSDILLGDIHANDKITIIPSSDAYNTRHILVQDSVVAKNLLNITLYRKGMPIKGIFIDKNTGMPISNISINLCTLNPLETTSRRSLEDVTYKHAITDSKGRYNFDNCFYKYIYYFQYSVPGYICKPHDVIALSDTLTYVNKLSPTVFNVIITDGKKPLKGATIECKNIYNKIFTTDETGTARIIGFIDNSFIIKLDGFVTLKVLSGYSAGTHYIKMKKGRSDTTIQAKYDWLKDKLKYL